MGAVQMPVSTSFPQLDELIQKVKENARAFARLSIDDRIRLCEQMKEGFAQVAEESVIAACQAKGIDPKSPLAGEEWLGGPMITIRVLRLTLQALRDIKRYGAPRLPRGAVSALPDGRLRVKVFPASGFDRALLAGHTAWVHLEPGITAENLREHQASFFRKPHEGALCLVLGAGNVNAIPPTDVVYKMFTEGKVCILKMNPVNGYLGPFIERAFRAAIERGFLAVTYGGPEEGAHLVQHPQVDEVHITGSDKTYDTMVWGPPGPERDERKRRNEPVLHKDVSAELGNITPILLVPGPYSPADLESQGRSIAGMVSNNASFNCVAAKLLVTPRASALRAPFVEAIERGLGRAAVRKAYYPGAEQRWRRFTDGRPGLKLVGKAGPGELPYALILGVDPANEGDIVFHDEPWCTVLSETSVDAADAVAFLGRAVKLVNEKVWGSLTAQLVVHPATMRDRAGREAVERAIRELRYGSVSVNTWSGTGFGLGTTPWGAAPGATPQDIQSGKGWVHNTFMLEGIEKAVIWAPLRAMPAPPWFPGHRTLDALAKEITSFEASPSWLKLPAIVGAAMRG